MNVFKVRREGVIIVSREEIDFLLGDLLTRYYASVRLCFLTLVAHS